MVEFCQSLNNSDLDFFLTSVKHAIKTKHHEENTLSFDRCQHCLKRSETMSSIPQGMFAAKKLREKQEKNMTIARINIADNSANSKKYFNTRLMELTPLKYNSKLMNSIWGLYNRYSPHNIKSTIDETNASGDLQQSVANLPKPTPNKDGLEGGSKLTGKVQSPNSVPNFDNFWKNIPISQSQ